MRTMLVLTLAITSLTAVANLALALDYAGGPLVYNPANGHYYQYWEWTGGSLPPLGTHVDFWAEQVEVASSARCNGWPGYLATFTSWAEFGLIEESNDLRWGGRVGALGDGTTFRWAGGPEMGQVAQIYNRCCDSGCGRTVLCASCGPCENLRMAGTHTYTISRVGVFCQGTTAAFVCSGEPSFIVEYSPPVIISVTPDLGSWSPGDGLTVTGWGFLPESLPMVNGAVASPYQVVSLSEIRATIPSLSDGSYELKVVIPGAGTLVWPGQVVGESSASWGTLKALYR